MELLIGLLAEFILLLVLPVVTLVIDAVAAVVALIAYWLFGWTRHRPASAPKQTPGQPQQSPAAPQPPTGGPSLPPALRKGFMILTGLSGGILLAGLAAALVVNLFFLHPVASWIAERVSERSRIAIAFDHVEGNLLAGAFTVRNLDLKRTVPGKTEYALTTGTVHLDLDMTSLLFGDTTLSHLSVEGVRGEIRAKAEAPETQPAAEQRNGAPKPARDFVVETLVITDAVIDLHKAGAPSVPLAIERLSSTPFRSYLAVFDVFFRSNVTGSIGGHPVRITTSGTDAARTTRWRLTDFPAAFISHYADRVPFTWFESGTIDITVDDSWNRENPTEIDMDWHLVLKDVKVVRPDDAGLISRALAMPVSAYINGRDEDIDLRFRLVMNKEQFRSKSSLDAAGLWQAVLEGAARAIAEKSGATADDVKSDVRRAVDGLKGWLDKRREKRSPE